MTLFIKNPEKQHNSLSLRCFWQNRRKCELLFRQLVCWAYKLSLCFFQKQVVVKFWKFPLSNWWSVMKMLSPTIYLFVDTAQKKQMKMKTDFDKARFTCQLYNIWSMKQSQINVLFMSFGQSIECQNWCWMSNIYYCYTVESRFKN